MGAPHPTPLPAYDNLIHSPLPDTFLMLRSEEPARKGSPACVPTVHFYPQLSSRGWYDACLACGLHPRLHKRHEAYLVISQCQLGPAQGLGLLSHRRCPVPSEEMDGRLARWMNERKKAHQHSPSSGPVCQAPQDPAFRVPGHSSPFMPTSPGPGFLPLPSSPRETQHAWKSDHCPPNTLS